LKGWEKAMLDIIQRLRDTYAENPAAALKLLPELFQAADDGKIPVLPCKVGDMVYVINTNRVVSRIEEIVIIDGDIIFRWAQYDVSYGLAEFLDDGEFSIKEIGKTVFLTPESVEAALKEHKT
jgi:hypothetical protein